VLNDLYFFIIFYVSFAMQKFGYIQLTIYPSVANVLTVGASYSSIVGYVLGFPFLNDTVLNETMMVPRQWYDYDDMNISDFMMYMFTSFAKYGCVHFLHMHHLHMHTYFYFIKSSKAPEEN